MRPSRSLLCLLAVCACASACWVPIEQGREMQADIVKLKSELSDQQRRRADDEARAEREQQKLKDAQAVALRKIDAKIKEVGDTLDALNHAARKTGADLAVELDKTRGDVDHLRGRVEEAQNQYQTAEAELSQAKATLDADDARLKVLEAAKKAADDAAAQAAAAEAARQKALWRPANKADYYKQAKAKLDAGDTGTARQWFTEFLAKYKKDPLDSNAQYWIGESYYAEKKWREAVFAFRTVSDKYPKSAKAPDALLKIGYAFIELGHTDDAKLFLETVEKSYPKAPAAKLARKKLVELRHKR